MSRIGQAKPSKQYHELYMPFESYEHTFTHSTEPDTGVSRTRMQAAGFGNRIYVSIHVKLNQNIWLSVLYDDNTIHRNVLNQHIYVWKS